MDNNDYIHKDSEEEMMQPEPPQQPAQQPPFPPQAQPQMLSAEEHKRRMTTRTLASVLISALVTFLLTLAIVVVAISAYFPLTNGNDTAGIQFDDKEETAAAVDKLQSIIDTIRDNYYTELTDAQILEAMSAGLPGELGSPYTYYLTAEESAEIEEAMSGQYVGIGCSVTLTPEGEVELVEVYAGSPALEAGLQTGDVITSVNGENLADVVDISQVVVKVKGEEGSEVTIGIYRPSAGKTMEFTMERRTIVMQNVKHRMLTKDIGYVYIKGFVNGVETDFAAAMDDLQEQGAKNIVFDLRYNSGGSASVMTSMLEYLLPEGTLLATIKGRNDGTAFSEDWKTQGGMSVPDSMRYAILVNSYSASASEFFSGCLRDHGKAVLIGENTFGKGSGTSTYTLEDGSAINVTIFQYYLPSGVCIEGTGLKPDIEAVLPEEYRYTSIELLTEEQDTVLQKAIAELGKP